MAETRLIGLFIIGLDWDLLFCFGREKYEIPEVMCRSHLASGEAEFNCLVFNQYYSLSGWNGSQMAEGPQSKQHSNAEE